MSDNKTYVWKGIAQEPTRDSFWKYAKGLIPFSVEKTHQLLPGIGKVLNTTYQQKNENQNHKENHL